MHARVSTFVGSADQYDAGLQQTRETVLPQVRELEGFRGALALIDRSTGKALTITLWETEDALRASEERASELRQQVAAASAEQIAGVERYEVALLELP